MKRISFSNIKSPGTPKGEQGMAMIMALLMGIALVAGATGLMIRQIMARKLGAAESYNQLAESAALNGLNRIISDLNKDNRENYSGFLLTLRNDPKQWGWASPNMPAPVTGGSGTQLIELCTPVDRFISAYPQGTKGEAAFVPINTGNIRDDGNEDEIEVGYRLRSYNTTATSGNGEGSFYVEGIVKRGKSILARALLKRALFISSRVAGAGDWAVMSGHNLRLNDTTINGPGNIFYLTKFPDSYSATKYSSICYNSLRENVNSSNDDLIGAAEIVNEDPEKDKNRIWPINIDETKRGVSGLPPTNLFEKDRVNDTTTDSNSGTIRIWSFDDSEPTPADRDGDGINDTDENDVEILYSKLPCGESICVRDADATSKKDYRTLSQENINLDSSSNTITLSKEILCNNSDSFDCHVYLDHVNLSKTKLHIETSDTRAIVLHLDQPVSYPNDLNLNQAIKLSGSAKLCGVNISSSSCNNSPEQLVITASGGSAPSTDACGRTEQSVSFTGSTLPSALMYLPTGIVRPNNATLTGLIWASSICVLKDDNLASSFTLTTEQNGISVVQKANDLWGWSERFNYPGYGRMVTRAIRGTSLDIFERW